MCPLNIALRKYMVVEAIGIILRYLHMCFLDKYNFTKNRGACVENIIWLLGIYKPNYFKSDV
jgi:hypothetical protein